MDFIFLKSNLEEERANEQQHIEIHACEIEEERNFFSCDNIVDGMEKGLSNAKENKGNNFSNFSLITIFVLAHSDSTIVRIVNRNK
jgi:hypothetical protein